MLNNYLNILDFYKKNLSGTGYLAFRDLPTILPKSEPNLELSALDFGCGAGRSSNILKNMGYNVTGIDINNRMIKEAQKFHGRSIDFIQMQNNSIPLKCNHFDLVFNSFVMLDMPTKNELILNFKEMKRVCKTGGKVVTVTNSDFLFSKTWSTIKTDFNENKNLFSGKVVKIQLTDVGITLHDYFWTEKDYIYCLHKAGFQNIDIIKPLADCNERYEWKDETKFPPYSIYVCNN